MGYQAANLLSANDAGFETSVAGWAAGSNTTLTRQTTTALAGTASMRMVATAAGSVSATLSTRVAVTAGTEYTAYVPVGLATTTAGLTVTVSVAWYSAPSGGSAISTSTSPALSLSSSVGWSAQRCVLVAAAPVGATYGQLSVTVSGLATSGAVYVDGVYVAASDRRAGNLLSYNAQSVEMSVSPWTVTGATATRGAAILLAGNASGEYTITANATAAGPVVLTSPTVPVTPGIEYAGYTHIYSTASAPCLVSLQWLDAASALISADTTSWNVAATGPGLIRGTAVGTAPVGAVTARLVITVTANAAGHIIYADEAFIGIAPNAAGNYLKYNDYSAEATPPPWSADNATIEWRTDGLASAEGFGYLRYTPTAADVFTLSLNRLVSVVPGNWYEVSARFMLRNATGSSTVSMAARLRPVWCDVTGNTIATSSTESFTPVTRSTAGTSGVQYGYAYECPANATKMRVEIDVDHRLMDAQPYYDVDTVSAVDYTPNYSAVVSDVTGSIRVQFNASATTPTTYSVSRIDADGSEHPVRSYEGFLDRVTFISYPVIVTDYEAPLDTDVTYRIKAYNAAGDLVRLSPTGTIHSPVLPSGDYVWLKNPGLPAVNSTVILESPPSWSRPANAAEHRIVGARNPVVVNDVRGGRTTTVSALVFDRKIHETLDKLLDPGSPALIQAMPGLGLSGNVYVSIGDADSEYLSSSAREDGWRWVAKITEIDRPTGGMQGSPDRTWQTISADFATWDDLFTAHSDWIGVLIDDPS